MNASPSAVLSVAVAPCASCAHAENHHLGCRLHEGCCGADGCACMGYQPRRACTRALAVTCDAADGLPCADCAEEAARFRATATKPQREEWVVSFELILGVPGELGGALFDRLHEPPARFRQTALALFGKHLQGEELLLAVQAAMYARAELP